MGLRADRPVPRLAGYRPARPCGGQAAEDVRPYAPGERTTYADTELLTGHPDCGAAALVRAEYDPVVHSLRQQELTKVAELRAAGEEVGLSTLRRMRSRFEREGVVGLVDGRMRRPATGI